MCLERRKGDKWNGRQSRGKKSRRRSERERERGLSDGVYLETTSHTTVQRSGVGGGGVAQPRREQPAGGDL